MSGNILYAINVKKLLGKSWIAKKLKNMFQEKVFMTI